MAMSSSYTLRNKRVWVAGDRGLVGSALVRRLQREGCELLTAPRESVDLRRPDQLERWMAGAKPQAVFLAAARVGGIYANDTRPAEFIYDNLMIQSNVVEASRRAGVEKLMLLGSSCIYPRLAPQPIPEAALLTGP
ncbi:MAG: NAD-dependent epimerase/dehydratase family protein, partial [Reyranella sp.]